MDQSNISRGTFTKLSRIDCQPPPAVRLNATIRVETSTLQVMLFIFNETALLPGLAALQIDCRYDKSSQHLMIQVESSIFLTIPSSFLLYFF